MVQLIYTNYQIDQTESSILWHFHDLFTYYTSYQIDQMEFSTLWHFYDLLYKLSNRTDKIVYPLALLRLTQLQNTK